jgi:hypothetical protein
LEDSNLSVSALDTITTRRALRLNVLFGAGNENRTRVLSLEGCDNTIILYPLYYGAGTKIRTRDLLITNQLLYQLSYAGVSILMPLNGREEGIRTLGTLTRSTP